MALSSFSNRSRGGSSMLGTIRDAVIFETPGGEGDDAPEKEVTPTIERKPDAGSNPVTVILAGAAMFVLGVFGLRKLLD